MPTKRVFSVECVHIQHTDTIFLMTLGYLENILASSFDNFTMIRLYVKVNAEAWLLSQNKSSGSTLWVFMESQMVKFNCTEFNTSLKYKNQSLAFKINPQIIYDFWTHLYSPLKTRL